MEKYIKKIMQIILNKVRNHGKKSSPCFRITNLKFFNRTLSAYNKKIRFEDKNNQKNTIV